MRYRNFIYDATRGFIFAYVPKVACTNWKSVMRYLAGHPDYLDSRLAHDRAAGGLRYLEPDREAADRALLHDPAIARYAVVRDPYSRTLSAYLNKVEARLPGGFAADARDHFHTVLCNIDAFRAETLDPARHPEVDFEVFLLWLRESGSHFRLDEHFRAQSVLLKAGEVDYDILGRFETLDTDSRRILDAMGCDIDLPTQKDVKFAPTHARDKVADYYDDTRRALVAEIFAEDFAAYGYAA